MGPSWISIRNFRKAENSKSWCKIDIVVDNFNTISPSTEAKRPAPPLKVIEKIPRKF